MPNHGTALNSRQLGEFVGAGTKALIRIADRLGTDVAKNWAKNGRAMENAMLSALLPPESSSGSSEGSPKSVLALILNGRVNATQAKKTKDCFTANSRYIFRDGALDKEFPKNQTAGEAGKFSVHKLAEPLIFLEIFAAATAAEQDIQAISKSLVARNQVWVLPQIEDMIERQEKSEEVGLLTDGSVNFFPVLNNEGIVSVVRVDRGGGRWHVDVFRLDDVSRWVAGNRVFIRNLDPVFL